MRLKIRKVCLWIILVQILLLAVHLKSYRSFTGLGDLSTKDTIALTSFTPANSAEHLRNGSTNKHSKFKEVNAQNMGELSVELQLKDGIASKSSQQNVTPKHIVQLGDQKRIISNKRNDKPKSSARKCSNLDFPVHLEHGDTWQAVDNKTTFVFSAYYLEKKKTIVIIGAKLDQEQPYICLLWQEENGTRYAEPIGANVRQLPEGHNLRYSVVFFECRLSSYSKSPSHVSLVTSSCGVPSNLLRVRSTTKPKSYPRRFTVCLVPLHTKYGRAYELVEWIELNRILGAEKFIVYNLSSADNVKRVLDHYVKQEVVEIVQWQLPKEIETDNNTKEPRIHYNGQIAALQDCLYRNKVESEFIVNIDLDEFIVPHGENISSWNDMLKQLNNESGAYIFRNTFFRKEWDSAYFTNKEIVDKYKLVTLQKLYREEKLFSPRHRSKYFARTIIVSQVMIHDVIFLPKKNMAQIVATETGLLHHYRDWENDFSLPDLKVFNDTIPRKYGESLIKNVANIWSRLINVEMEKRTP